MSSKKVYVDASKHRRAAAVVGIGHTNWGQDWTRVRNSEKPNDSYGYAATALVNALNDAGITKSEIDGLIVGPTTAYERMAEILGVDPKWGDQADAVLSVAQAVMAIESGLAETIALVYGNDQRSGQIQYGGPQAMGGDSFLSYIYHAPWGLTSQGALYALTFQAYKNATGFGESDLARVAVAQREWSSQNPNAVMRKRIEVENYLEAPYICEPLRLYDYCMINDGGVALIVTAAEKAKTMKQKPVYIDGLGRRDLNSKATSLEPRLTEFYHPAQEDCAKQAFAMAGIGPEDVDILQVYDSFSVHIPLALEGYGYCRKGEAAKFLAESGVGPGGKLPVNTSGGHLSESYMQGWAHQVESVRQLRGECGDRQVHGCNWVHYTSDVAGKAVSIIYGK
ncbi:lipid-transfer protein [Advenella sp. S44]|uniref:thiolase family protein n=1 Tax=Advenella sp. S44 TaxID=1982755 RepID=UPI000C29F2F0|nr:thiolase family protein [Advenella sp. S44]PJX26156.1 lipid-transfer protein [Advenella sp. S44]